MFYSINIQITTLQQGCKKTVDSQQSLHTCSVYAQVQVIHSKGRQILSHKGFIQYLIDCEGR